MVFVGFILIAIGIYELIAVGFTCYWLYSTTEAVYFWKTFLFAQGWIIPVIRRFI